MSNTNSEQGRQAQTTATKPLVVIVGETASGKSSLGLELAQELDGEIISADSRMVYKGMDIGTAKPAKRDQSSVAHHMIDVVEPVEEFTVADFKHMALEAIDGIRKRGKLPIMVGGTGLYVDAVVFDYTFRRRYDKQIRAKLEELPLERLQKLALQEGFKLESRDKNRRRLIRLLETGSGVTHADRKEMIDDVLLVGIKLSRSVLRQNIETRVEQMFRRGLRKEVDELVKRYGWEHEALTGIGYREFESYYLREISMSELKRQIVQHTLGYAKRQRTWFKRNPHIHWFSAPETAKSFIRKQIKRV